MVVQMMIMIMMIVSVVSILCCVGVMTAAVHMVARCLGPTPQLANVCGVEDVTSSLTEAPRKVRCGAIKPNIPKPALIVWVAVGHGFSYPILDWNGSQVLDLIDGLRLFRVKLSIAGVRGCVVSRVSRFGNGKL